jgi:D-alanyl-lipoteichoic acid acyltransferase DltB (MBOAT superfamily)
VLATFQILVVSTVLASFAYWLLPAGWVEGRRAVLLVVSGVLIYIYSPATLFLAVGTALLAWALYALTRRHPERGWLPWLVVLPLVIDAIVPLGELIPFPAGSPRSVLFTTLTTLGMSFYTFKLYASIKQGLKLQSLPFREVITTTLFYPAFPMGPIDASQTFDRAALTRDPDLRRWAMGVGRIGMGAVKALVIGEWIKTTASIALFGAPMDAMYDRGWDGPVQALLFAFVSFAYLYVNFSGFTDVAIGAGWMFNLDLSENFRFPLIAHSIQNFWQRWHLSLSRFITTYMFKPMLRRTGRTALTLIVTFTLIGLWHRTTVGYLIWGLGHGCALALTAWYRTRRRPPLPVPFVVRRAVGIAVTLTFVSLLSTIANQPSNRALARYVLSFAGIHVA